MYIIREHLMISIARKSEREREGGRDLMNGMREIKREIYKHGGR
jgi:hypothetical protein